jgi:hypothetical protein
VTVRQSRPCLQPHNPGRNVATYLESRDPDGRYASFDYCYNFFQAFREQDATKRLLAQEVLESACMSLGFYLASWGMLRGSTYLLQRSARHLVPVIKVIADAPDEAWEIDADAYSRPGVMDLMEGLERDLRIALRRPSSDTLITKILLGVFGCVPAFDTNFKKGSGLSIYGRSALLRLEEFYVRNASVIESHRIFTLDFLTGEETDRRYPRAKVIDMVFFVEGA